ncbi:large ribosomal subunit protein eL28 isoform X2 [Hydra vulgaris]|uniref:Large ribosomal subunit protein eL28 n=1 Tax=Hydra vulgaris TaxID=6087 RepID=A0ABM4DMY8_HYDVU
MSAELCWSVLRKNSCFLVKSQGLTLTKEPHNLTGLNSFKYNGLVNKKTVGVTSNGGKGVVLTIRKKKLRGQKHYDSSVLLKGSRHTMKSIKNKLSSNGYRKDLIQPAMRRACAILRSQKTTVMKKSRSRRKKN